MSALPWLPIAVKALATALTVITASLAAEALGPVWAAVIVCLPVAAGPAYVFLALEHGPDFIAVSALNSAAANAVTGLFLMTYATLAGRLPAWRSLTLAVGTWLVGSVALQQVPWSVATVVALNVAVYGNGLILLHWPRAHLPAPVAAVRSPLAGRRRWFELPLRAVAVAAVVTLVVGGSAALGPAMTGIAAVFPVSLISLIAILLPTLGGPATARVAASALPPMVGFGAMLLVMHATVRPWGIPVAFGLALATSLLWSAILLLVQTGARGRVLRVGARRATQPVPGRNDS